MGDTEAGFEIARRLLKEGFVWASIPHHKMDSQRVRCSAERPDMKIMQINDAWERAWPCPDRGQIDAFRDAVEAQVERRFEEPESRPRNHCAHEDCNDRIDSCPVGKDDHESGHNYAGGHRGVRYHMQECASDIDIARTFLHEQERGPGFDRNPDCGHPKDARSELCGSICCPPNTNETNGQLA